MPKNKIPAAAEKTQDVRILRMGRQNNIIQWRDEMYTLLTTKYGATGSFLMTDVAYVNPMPHERDYNPFYVEPIDLDEEDSDDDDDDDDEEEAAAEVGAAPQPQPARDIRHQE
jgi:hypothetical protein